MLFHHHHHIVQVAMCACSVVCTLVNALVRYKGKHHQRNLQQVMTTMTANGVFSLVEGRENTTSASCKVSRQSWAQVYERDAATKCSLHKGTTLIQILPRYTVGQPLHFWLTCCIILSKITPLVAVLVPLPSSMATVSKAYTPLPQKSDRSNAEHGEHHQSLTLSFSKCL